MGLDMNVRSCNATGVTNRELAATTPAHGPERIRGMYHSQYKLALRIDIPNMTEQSP